MTTQRITAPIVNTKVDNHLLAHELTYDKTQNRHDILLVGEKGDKGLCATVNDHENRITDLENVGKKVSTLTWSIAGWAVIELLSALPKIFIWLDSFK